MVVRLLHERILLIKSDLSWIALHLQLVVFFPNVAPCVHHLVHLLHLAQIAGLLHPLSHHLVHVVICELFFALEDISEKFAIRLLVFLLFLSLHFFGSLSCHFFLLPLIAQISVDFAELGLLLCIFHKLIIL